MKKWILGVGALLFAVAPALAGIRYEFQHSTRSNSKTSNSSSFAGRAILDGELSRIDVLGGTIWPKGSYLLNGAGNKLVVVNPAKKSYQEIELSKRDPFATEKIEISNPTIEFKELEDSEIIAGYPTRHYQLVTTYDITVYLGQIVLKQSVRSVIDKWTTTAFDSVIQGYRDYNEVFTGKPEVDSLIEAEVNRFKGLPLRQITTITTTTDPKRGGGSQGLESGRRRVTEMLVRSIENVPEVDPELFRIPMGFNKEQPVPSTSAHYLTMTP